MGMVIGTPQYMSPEQAQGLLTVDHRTDIYSLGAVLFEAIVGGSPYHEMPTYEQTILQIMTRARAAHLVAAIPDVHPELDQLCADMMAHDPNARPRDMSAGARAAPPDLPRDRRGADADAFAHERGGLRRDGGSRCGRASPRAGRRGARARRSLGGRSRGAARRRSPRQRSSFLARRSTDEPIDDVAGVPQQGKKSGLLIGVVAILALVTGIGVVAIAKMHGAAPAQPPAGSFGLVQSRRSRRPSPGDGDGAVAPAPTAVALRLSQPPRPRRRRSPLPRPLRRALCQAACACARRRRCGSRACRAGGEASGRPRREAAEGPAGRGPSGRRRGESRVLSRREKKLARQRASLVFRVLAASDTGYDRRSPMARDPDRTSLVRAFPLVRADVHPGRRPRRELCPRADAEPRARPGPLGRRRHPLQRHPPRPLLPPRLQPPRLSRRPRLRRPSRPRSSSPRPRSSSTTGRSSAKEGLYQEALASFLEANRISPRESIQQSIAQHVPAPEGHGERVRGVRGPPHQLRRPDEAALKSDAQHALEELEVLTGVVAIGDPGAGRARASSIRRTSGVTPIAKPVRAEHRDPPASTITKDGFDTIDAADRHPRARHGRDQRAAREDGDDRARHGRREADRCRPIRRCSSTSTRATPAPPPYAGDLDPGIHTFEAKGDKDVGAAEADPGREEGDVQRDHSSCT